jgi:hypothetical protein
MRMKLFCDDNTDNIQTAISHFLKENTHVTVKFVKQSMFGEYNGFNVGMVLVTIWYE